MNRPSHFFNIESAEQLFNLLKTVAGRLANSDEKRTEDFLLLVFGLTHLREWIAPDYNWKERPPSTPEEHFYQDIWKFEEFKFLRALCNRSKHMCVTEQAMGALYKSEAGHRLLVGYFADGKDVEDAVRAVIKYYEEKWFRKSGGSKDAT
jgi:hypothetical protein